VYRGPDLQIPCRPPDPGGLRSPTDTFASILQEIVQAKIPHDVPDTCPDAQEVRALLGFLKEVQNALRLLSEGDLAFEVKQRGPFAGSIKALQASLRHLTWQTRQVAEGDFEQRVDFMGEFAASFNTMVDKLKSSRETILQRNKDLEIAYAKLQESQDRLLQQQKLASIGQLAAGMAHEINNPLSFMHSNLNRFEEYYRDSLSLLHMWQEFGKELEGVPAYAQRVANILDEESRTDLAFIEKDFTQLMSHSRSGATRIQSIVKQMRHFADARNMPVILCNIHLIIDDALKDVTKDLRPNISVVKKYGDTGEVLCTPQEMRLVFAYLLKNAIEAIAEAGEISIHTSLCDGFVRVSIRDTGCGIPPENLSRIFDPFFTTRPPGKGVGLGLWMVSTLVQSVQGMVSVESEAGKGSTFSLMLPGSSAR
jgi:two-component system, NtrC family, sensor kinase